MKIIIPIAFSLVLHFSASAQEHNMPMPKKEPSNENKMDMGTEKMDNMPIKSDKAKAKSSVSSVSKSTNNLSSKTVRYDLYVGDTTVNFMGKNAAAMAINGQIPAPTLHFTEGDTALIYVHNRLKTATSMHWHGVIVPNQYDGVSYLTTAPILPNTTHLFTFPIVQNGTYWYHSHDLTEQIGLYGALIIDKKDNAPMSRAADKLPEEVVVLSEWTNENPNEINRRLHTATDWYSIKKRSTQSYGEALVKGYFGIKLLSDWKRILPMDVADIYYDRFLINGQVNQKKGGHKKGDKVRIRLINGGASSYFWVQYAGGKMTIIANDGKDVEPVEVDRLVIGNGETYDFTVIIPEDMAYELKATPEDRTKFASLFLGNGMEMTVPEMPKLKYFEGMKMMNAMMNMNGNMMDMGMNMSAQKMDMNNVMYPEIMDMKMSGMKDMNHGKDKGMDDMKGMNHGNKPMETSPSVSSDILTFNYAMLRSTQKTTLPNAPTKEIRFELTGNMNRYVWTMDNKSISETDKILIKQGENVRIILYNGSMMRHPMHLHGHFFRVLNGQGDYAPLKHTVDIMPMETDTLEFAANESGNWFFHCHILYHMAAGMGRIFSYENSPPNPEIPDAKAVMHIMHKAHNPYYTAAKIGLESNGSDGLINHSNARWIFQTAWHLGLNDRKGYESETTFGRYIGKMQWLLPYVGFDYHFKKLNPTEDKNIFGNEETNMFGQKSNKNNRRAAVFGFAYTLPMFLVADARVDSDGKFRFQLGREDIALTNRLRLNFMLNTDREYALGARYVLTKYFSLSSHYDSDMGLGGGLTIIY
jgi:CopA family copper-resistance protein